MTRGGTSLVYADRVLTSATGEVIADGGVLVVDGVIAAVGQRADLPTADTETYAGSLLIPGMVDAHSHLRGIPLSAQGIPPRILESWLCSLGAMTSLDAYDDALIAGAELLETGVTSVQAVVHDFDGRDGYTALSARVAAAAEDIGLRALLVAGFTDRAEFAPEPATGVWLGAPAVAHGMAAAEFGVLAHGLLGVDDEPTQRVRWGIGPVAAQWAGDAALAIIATAGRRHRLHTHLHESRLQRGWLSGEPTPLARLAVTGCLGERLSAAHAVDLRTDEMDVVAATGTTLVHCPSSNRALGVGTARVAEWRRRGIRIALGLDSQGERADMFAEMRTALAVAAELGDPLDPADVFAMATTGGASALGVPGLGRIAPGSPADLTGLALDTDAASDSRAVADLVVRHGSPEAVLAVWVGGRQVVADGRAVVDTTEARRASRTTLDADAEARAARRDTLAPLLDALEAEIAGSIA